MDIILLFVFFCIYEILHKVKQSFKQINNLGDFLVSQFMSLAQMLSFVYQTASPCLHLDI